MSDATQKEQYCFGKEDYGSKFDPQSFLKDYAKLNTEGHGDTLSAVFQLDLKWIETFASGAVKGQTLLDFGCGPCLHHAIPASRCFGEIYMCEYAPQNRQVIQDWIDKQPNAHDWTPFFKFVAEKEGEGATYQEIEQRLRKKIKSVTPCDVYKENMFEPVVFEPDFFDCISENFCIGSACKTADDFKATVKKLSIYIKPGGRLFMVGGIGETYYMVADEKFSYLNTTPQLLEEAFKEGGFKDFRLENLNLDYGDMASASDVKWVYFVEGTKQ